MKTFIEFLIVFAVGGGICVLGQLLINFTKMTSARILVIFLLLGVILEACGVFEPIKQAVHAGVTIPITGFGSTLAKGAIKGAKEKGLLGAITGGTEAAGAGIAGAIFIGFVSALLGKPKTKD